MNEDILSKLERLAKLKEQGVLSQAEFEKHKAEILQSEKPKPHPPTASTTTTSTPILSKQTVDGSTPWGKIAGIAIGGIFVLFIFGSTVQKCQQSQDELTTYPLDLSGLPLPPDSDSSETSTPPTKVENWSYSNEDDKINGRIKIAEATSENSVEFDFPYQGGSYGYFLVRKMGGNTNIIFRVSKGQFNTNIVDGGSVKIKLDNGPVKTYTTSMPSDGSSDVVFIDAGQSLIKKLKQSKSMVIQAEFYNEGLHQYEFNTEGLNW